MIQAVNKNPNGISFPIFNDKDLGIIRILSSLGKPLITAHQQSSKNAVLLSTLTEIIKFGLEFFRLPSFREQIKFAEFEVTKMFNGIKTRIFILDGSNEAYYLNSNREKVANSLSVGIAGMVMHSQNNQYVFDINNHQHFNRKLSLLPFPICESG